MIQVQLKNKRNPDSQQQPPKYIIDKLHAIIHENMIVAQKLDIQQKQFFGYISPASIYALLWDSLVIACIYVYLIEIGFVLGFGSAFWVGQLQSSNSIALYIFLIIIFTADIVVSFFKGFYKMGKGRVIKQRSLIIRRYVRSYLSTDIISTLCIIIPLVAQNYVYDLFQFVFFVKLWKKAFYQQQIYRQVQHRIILRNIVFLAGLAADTAVIAHFVACLFVGIDIQLNNVQFYGSNSNLYWLSNNGDYSTNLVGGQWYIQYIYGQQYSTGTLSTLAPGPFPKNPIEAMYVIVIMSSFIILTSYIADGIITLFYSEQQRRVFHETNIQIFDNYMKVKNVSKAVKDRVQNYFELVWEVEGKVDLDFQRKVINKLSVKLKEQLLGQLINLKPIKFLDYLDPTREIEKHFVTAIEQIMTDSNQILFQPTWIKREKYIYLPVAGMVKFYVNYGMQPTKQNIYSLSNVEKIIGAYEFITNQQYTYCAKTIHITHFHRLSKQKFLNIIDMHSLMLRFFQVRDRLLYSNELSIINKRCLICLETHLEANCRQINISSKIKHQLINSVDAENKRKKYKRKNTRVKLFRNKNLEIKPKQVVQKSKEQLMLQIQNLLSFDTFLQDLFFQATESWANFNLYFPQHNIRLISLV